jgi:hypothetical protein
MDEPVMEAARQIRPRIINLPCSAMNYGAV